MIGTRRVLALIPARGGSKGLPGKNLLPVAGRPMISFSIDAARASRFIDAVVVSSDDEQIMDAAVAAGAAVPFRRPAELATDEASSIDVVLHALEQLPGYDMVVLLQPTSPLRSTDDIDQAIEQLIDRGAPACVSVSAVEQSPYWMYSISSTGVLVPVLSAPSAAVRRQDLPTIYALNGAVYVAEVAWLRASRSFVTSETVSHIMPACRSVDIDTAADFEHFKRILTDRFP